MTPAEHTMLEVLRQVAANSAVNPEIMARVRTLVDEHTAQAEEEFRRLAPAVGADPDWYGTTFVLSRKVFTVMGINVGRPKNPMTICDSATGKTYRCSVSYVRSGILRTEPATRKPRRRTRKRNLELEV